MTMNVRRTLILLAVFAVFAVPAWAAPQQDTGASEQEHQFLLGRLAAEEGNLATATEIFTKLINDSPDDPVLRFERASVYLASRKVDLAEDDLRIAVAKDPKFYDAEKLLGRILLDQSGGDRMKAVDALDHLQKAWTLSPDDFSTGLTVVQILIGIGRESDAEPILKAMVERSPDNRTLNFQYAQLLTKLGRGDESKAYLERVVEIDPTFKPAVYALADIYQRSDEWKKAADILQPVIDGEPLDLDLQKRQAYFYLRAGEPGEARDRLSAILEADPKDDRAKYFLAEALGDLGEPEKAEPLYVELLAKTPDDPELLVSYGINQLVQRHYDSAAEQFNHILGIEDIPDGLRRLASTQLAGIAHAEKQYDEALESARKLVDNGDRPNLQAISIALDVLQREKKFVEAVTLMRPLWTKYADQQAIRARWVESLYRAGDTREGKKVVEASLASGLDDAMAAEQGLAQAERYDDAIALLRKLSKDHGDDIDVMFQFGAMLERAGKKAGAEAQFLRLLDKHPDHAPTLNYLGYMWAEDGVHLEQAREMIQKAVDQAPRNGAYIDSLGWVYFRLGKLDLAKKYLSDAVDLAPDDATVHEHLADVLAQLGELDHALELYTKALDLEPTPEEAATLRSKISDLEKRVASNAVEN